MRVAWVLADERPGAAARVADAHVRHLRAAGHRVDVVIAGALRPVFPGHTVLPDGAVRLAHATGAYDVAVAASWRAWYAMFALDAAAHAHLVLDDDRRHGPLAERTLHEPGVARAVARPGLPVEDAVLAPLGVDSTAFHPRGRSGAGRVLIAGERRGPARPAGVEVWHLGSGRLGRRVGPVPLDAMPALLRSCDVLVDLEPGSGLLALEMIATGGAVITEAGADARRGARPASWDEGCGALASVLATARPLPAWRRAELRAVHELLAQPDSTPPVSWRVLARDLRQRGRRLVRRLTHRPPAVSRRATGERVLFAGRPEYYRSAWHDAVRDGWGVEAAVGVDAAASLAALPELAARTGAGTCVVFQPELLAEVPEVAAALRARGVRLVAYSTEPVPHDGAAAAHWDQLRRLDRLRAARAIPWDLVLHFDPASVETLRREGFGAVRAHPLPVSEALFHAEDVAQDIDVCFLGWSTPHREAFLHPLEHRHRTVHVAHGLFDEDARRLMNRSRLVVNLHAHAYPSFENRCVQALFCGRPLASEPLSNDLLAPGVDYLVARSPAELAGHVERVLAGHAPSPRFERARFLAASLREALA